ncbi:unnamed protein product [Tilletia laevis]|nr:hypothetical protein A4X03_0g5074 [Tilletia caries]CAD6897271.1 unnamed protein product [Tilletia controversa]CAD6920358.1 unnamed protein product [Tilletia laevis]CAD6976337.1 unnamed protein product [Tilletia controversa]
MSEEGMIEASVCRIATIDNAPQALLAALKIGQPSGENKVARLRQLRTSVKAVPAQATTSTSTSATTPLTATISVAAPPTATTSVAAPPTALPANEVNTPCKQATISMEPPAAPKTDRNKATAAITEPPPSPSPIVQTRKRVRAD